MNRLKRIVVALIAMFCFTGVFLSSSAMEAKKEAKNNDVDMVDITLAYYIEGSGMDSRAYYWLDHFTWDEVVEMVNDCNKSTVVDVMAAYISLKKKFGDDSSWPKMHQSFMKDVTRIKENKQGPTARGFLCVKDLTKTKAKILQEKLESAKDDEITEQDFDDAKACFISDIDAKITQYKDEIESAKRRIFYCATPDFVMANFTRADPKVAEQLRKNILDALEKDLKYLEGVKDKVKNLDFLAVQKTGRNFKYKKYFYEGSYEFDKKEDEKKFEELLPNDDEQEIDEYNLYVDYFFTSEKSSNLAPQKAGVDMPLQNKGNDAEKLVAFYAVLKNMFKDKIGIKIKKFEGDYRSYGSYQMRLLIEGPTKRTLNIKEAIEKIATDGVYPYLVKVTEKEFEEAKKEVLKIVAKENDIMYYENGPVDEKLKEISDVKFKDLQKICDKVKIKKNA